MTIGPIMHWGSKCFTSVELELEQSFTRKVIPWHWVL